MKRIIQLLAVASLSLGFASCDKNEDINNGGQAPQLNEVQRFELNSSLGEVGLEALSSNTDKAPAEGFRATLHFKGLTNAAQTTLNAQKYGFGKREARWGVIYDGGKYKSVNCEESVSVEPAVPSNLTKSTVFFKASTIPNTIENASIKMYCQTFASLSNITKSFMVLEGKAGSGASLTKQYYVGNTSPNHRIEPLQTNAFQEDRHIPIMTKVVDFTEMQKPLAENTVKFAPRGSLIGLNIKNRIDTDIIVTAIVVEKAGALDYSGYFDWKTLKNNKASFSPLYTSSQTGTAVSFPVYASKSATEVGYTIAKGNTTIPCFYIWGFQKSAQVGKPFQVQIRYKTATDPTEKTTRAFNVFAPNSQVVDGTRQFDDGYSYNTTITINTANKTGGSNGKDWNNGGILINDSEPHPGFSAPFTIKSSEFPNVSTYPKEGVQPGLGFGQVIEKFFINVDDSLVVVRLYDPANKDAGLKMDLRELHLTTSGDGHYILQTDSIIGTGVKLVIIPKTFLDGDKVPEDDKMLNIEVHYID